MRYYKNDVALFHANEIVLGCVEKFIDTVRRYPLILEAVRGKSGETERIFSSAGFILYSTVKKTTLFYNREVDCFFKILQPVNFKSRIFFSLFNRAQQIYNLSEFLIDRGISVPRIEAFGTLRSMNRPFFIMKRIEGKSLYDHLVKERNLLVMPTYMKIIEKMMELHRLGYWMGDAHLSHVFINDDEVKGFIDIDSIRRNRPFKLRNLAKDLAGFNNPKLPLTEEEKKKLLSYYMNSMNIIKKEKFHGLVKCCTERRWKKKAGDRVPQ
jgi:hypothetical protein